jgi:hypothetical protein
VEGVAANTVVPATEGVPGVEAVIVESMEDYLEQRSIATDAATEEAKADAENATERSVADAAGTLRKVLAYYGISIVQHGRGDRRRYEAFFPMLIGTTTLLDLVREERYLASNEMCAVMSRFALMKEIMLDAEAEKGAATAAVATAAAASAEAAAAAFTASAAAERKTLGFKCEEHGCNYVCTNRQTLKSHMKKHGTLKVCHVHQCGFSAPTVQKLSVHVKRKHPTMLGSFTTADC